MVKNAIVIPTFNRPTQLAKCLEAATAQDAEDFEVIVVDDGSPTPSAEVCAAFGPKVRYVRQANLGPAIARNTGVRNTAASFIAFTDDDCCPRRDWLSFLIAAHAGDDNRLVGGLVVNGVPNNVYASTSQAICDYLYHYFDAKSGTMPFFTSNNIGLSRVGFNLVNGFNEDFGFKTAEDREFCFRWRINGGTLYYSENAIIDHHRTMNFSQYWKQHASYGVGANQLHKVTSKYQKIDRDIEPPKFYFGLLAWPLRNSRNHKFYSCLLTAISQIAMIYGYYSALLKKK